jgi:hypothetical protein
MYLVEVSAEARRSYEIADAPLQRKLDRSFEILKGRREDIRTSSRSRDGWQAFSVFAWAIIVWCISSMTPRIP